MLHARSRRGYTLCLSGFAYLLVGLLSAGSVRADGGAAEYWERWNLKEAMKALAADTRDPIRLEVSKDHLVLEKPSHLGYAELSAREAGFTLDPTGNKALATSRSSQAEKILREVDRRKLLGTLRIAKALSTLRPNGKLVTVRASYSLDPDLSLTKLFRETLKTLSPHRHARHQAKELLTTSELKQMRALRGQLRRQLRTHDRSSLFGRLRRRWRAHHLRSERRLHRTAP